MLLFKVELVLCVMFVHLLEDTMLQVLAALATLEIKADSFVELYNASGTARYVTKNKNHDLVTYYEAT